ncbi:MAG TPA: YdjY domain-containing protein [Thermoanaerobaculia bacterium]|nr:YdjY domain-containing protein [Thermoanaerobaculia bacterium]
MCLLLRRALLCAAALLAVVACAGGDSPPAQVVRLSADTIEFPATVDASAFNRPLGMPGYHAIVWRGGKAAGAALFRADVTDVQVLDALEALGAQPGNRLGMDSWDARRDPKNPAPDQVIAGPPVEVLVRLPGPAGAAGSTGEPRLVPLAQLLDDPGGRGLDLRLGGHRANIPQWHSGCIVCLYSCPGSKLGNARYTVRDYVHEITRFRAKPDLLPPDGTPVAIRIRLLHKVEK